MTKENKKVKEIEITEDYLDMISKERADLRNQLQKEILEVTFTKVNGDKRTMNCTLI